MHNTLLRATIWAITFAAIAAVAAMHQHYVSVIAPDVPYMDTLRLLFQIDDWQAGRTTLYQLWADHAAHRGLIMEAVLVANMALFDLDIELANRLTGAVILCCAILLASAFLRDREARATRTYAGADWLVLGSAAITLGVLGFGLSGFELLTLDLGLSQWFKNLAFLSVFALYGRMLPAPSAPRALLLALLIPVVVLFIGMGWSYAFVAALVLVHGLVLVSQRRQGAARGVWGYLPLLSAVVSMALYVYGGTGGGDAEGSALPPAGQMLPLLATLPFYSVASAFIGTEAAQHLGITDGLLLCAGILVSALAGYALVRRWRRGLLTGSLLPVHAMAYSALFMASIALSRGAEGTAVVMSSRYYMEVILFVAGAVWLLAEDLLDQARPPRWAWAAYAIVVLTLAGGYAVSARKEWNTAPYRAHSFEVMRARLASGTVDQAMADLLQSPLPHASRGVQVMARRGLSIFRGNAQALCSGAPGYRSGWHAAEAAGHWSQRQARLDLPPCDCESVLEFLLPAQFSARGLSVRDGTGAVVRQVALAPGQGASVRLPAATSWSTWTLALSQATVPSRDLPGNPDMRELGVLLLSHAYACPATPAAAAPR